MNCTEEISNELETEGFLIDEPTLKRKKKKTGLARLAAKNTAAKHVDVSCNINFAFEVEIITSLFVLKLFPV